MTTSIVAATNRPALAQAHGDVKAWIGERLSRLRADLAEIEGQVKTARERHWGTGPLERQVRRLKAHEVFLSKVAGAIDAGYSIIPNFSLDMLAVRTEGEPPKTETQSRPSVGAARLPAGRGEYVNPEPEFQSWGEERTRERNGKQETYSVTLFQTTAHAPVDVPFVLMRESLADALHGAMTDKLFDEIGIARDSHGWSRRKRDPVLVGYVKNPRDGRFDRNGVSFFLGWWFDVRTLDLSVRE